MRLFLVAVALVGVCLLVAAGILIPVMALFHELAARMPR